MEELTIPHIGVAIRLAATVVLRGLIGFGREARIEEIRLPIRHEATDALTNDPGKMSGR